MHILTLTTLFPNSLQPVHGVFIRNRMESFTRKYGLAWTVLAPVPYFPRIPIAPRAIYRVYARVPALEEPWGYPIHHPRYLVTPKLGMRFYGSWMAEAVRRTVLEIHRKRPIDVIDCHYVYPDGTAGIRMGRELGIPVILSARGTDLSLYPRFPAIRPRIQRNLEACQHLICVCSDLQTRAVELGTPPEKTSVIGNGVDVQLFRKGDRGEARRKLGLPPTGRILLSVGHLTARKGFHLVLEAFAGLRDQDLFLVIAGEGEEKERLAKQAERLGIHSRVVFPGAVLNRDLPDWYSAADLFVLASSREGWPNVLCEAQAIGLPVVANRGWGGVPEIIDHPSLGILVEERNVEALRAALDRALQTRWDNTQIEERGRSRTWDQVSEKLLPVFQRALEGREHPYND
ncbi:MAG TPA: glycosyltransferase family 4 protein [Thermoanaerobaculia bacterium]